MNRAAALQRLARLPGAMPLVRQVRNGPAWRALAGCYRPFATLAEARAAAAASGGGGHEDPANLDWHTEMHLRPSDYAALVHMQPLLPGLRRVFDAGGSMGNLFYVYRRYLSVPQGLVWQVQDLPATIARGRRVAAENDAAALQFTTEWAQAEGADLLIASGSLHYFDRPLPDMVAGLAHKPPSILINRTPLTEGEPVATVQDGGSFRVGCMIYNRGQLIRAFEQLGYACLDQWPALELALHIPGFPEHSASHYTGLFLQRRSPD